MLIKRALIRRLVFLTLSCFVVFAISVCIYYYLSFFGNINSINISIDILRESLISGDILSNIQDNISGMYSVFISQMIIFLISVISLSFAIWHLTNLYLVQKKEAYVDSLTQVYNKRAILVGLRNEIRRTTRYNHSLCIAMLDLDYFKKYNDNNGHVAGDRLLRRAGRIMRKSIRDFDLVGRFGGEEFMIIFPETSLNQAGIICERIRKNIESAEFLGEEKMPDKKVTISIGVAEFRGKRKIRKNRFIEMADKNLYRAKEGGRNQVILDKLV